MVEPSRTGSSVRFFCTAGNGMETFLTEEVKKKLLAEDVCQLHGKVLFSSSAAIHRITGLKAAERLFLLLKKDSPLRMPTRCSRGTKAAFLLQSRLLGNRDQWISAAVTWSCLQRELSATRDLGGTRWSQERGESEDFAGSRKHRSELREPESEEQHEEKPSEKKRMRVEDGDAEMKRESNSFSSKILHTGDDGTSESVENGEEGLILLLLPLANRSYIKTTGLRSTVAWAMASLPGFCVVDPMCGVGTILIEAAQEHQDACFLGVDIDDGQLQRANENVAFADLGQRIQLLKASTVALPLPSGSVDAVICDLPFGKKFGRGTNMAADLPLILCEMERILCPGGILVVLLSPQLSCLLKKLLTQEPQEPAEPALDQKAKPQTVAAVCLSSTADLQQRPCPRWSSLKHQVTFRVSLGAIDGLIHKYIKI
uniref:THUMP domain containing 2 n=1 Tax=Oryzias melastigma TaxID=30732 RepID=A0A3B3E1G0_ORYME